ncbi:bifunctional hydroxymethylpyrimidine kinase/phosphomethylpyrimidine kinase [Butyrivibrio sp. LC3010]|uniref:bifunctional hydroxymethylpyrimidine kinase/phosphomethylpyrimidine kinase n=1 Tax=Butyrivibrio sp. LC3010 TaxID=1280680 RepID=UPI0003F8BD67|nr:bifunctional hydroxymethylpyrimidine kinase/phosphomethylpyrimidine kinase [Butyrivibrio sp. LC3010]
MIQKTVLTIAGSDSSGGAGIQADLKTMEAHDVYGMSVITALTAQNTMGVSGVLTVDKEFVAEQLRAVLSDITPDAVKIGMLPDIGIMETVVEAIDKYRLTNIVLDPVLKSTSGTDLSKESALEYMKTMLFPKCTLITPNIPEVKRICGIDIKSSKDMEEAAKIISYSYKCNVLIKGGHSTFEGDEKSNDLLFVTGKNTLQEDFKTRKSEDGKLITYEGERISNPNTHGTGCTLSSAIASNLAKGMSLEDAVKSAKEYIEVCIRAGLKLGHGRGPLYHGICHKNRN